MSKRYCHIGNQYRRICLIAKAGLQIKNNF